ncbi:uncharacterized protein IL334_006202 [Kwoniella shivajii]|uniref:Zn(2)-C6 fungal-type domain-containing protein n=1 Tax=Kwoniella shivajii TaxID=564305 RepID=A0ABZ1D5A2_9TREE|nr:hypothetical protein IL334_006202 [Kwoniella shivajii]
MADPNDFNPPLGGSSYNLPSVNSNNHQQYSLSAAGNDHFDHNPLSFVFSTASQHDQQQHLAQQRPLHTDASNSRGAERHAEHIQISPTAPSQTTEGGRPLRSRKNRPCDSCRKGKSRCSIGPQGPPCTHCSETNKSCTFDLAPPPRKPRQSRPDTGTESPDDPSSRSFGAVVTTNSRRNTQSRKRIRSISESEDTQVRPETSWRRNLRGLSLSTETATQSPAMSGLDVLASAVPSFDNLAESDYEPHVLTNPLTDDLLPIVLDNSSNDDSPKETDRAQVKQISSDPNRPIFVVLNPKPEVVNTIVPGVQSLAQLRTLLVAHPSAISEASMIQLYQAQIHPAWPILPHGKVEHCKPQLLAAVLTSTFSHSKESRSLAALAIGLLIGSSSGQTENNLAGVAASVLELGMRPINNCRSSYMQLARTIALAQLLGMHLNPLKWAIPTWEKELRMRLWWCLAIHDSWMSFLNSRPCHIQAYNTTVPLPSLSSVLLASCAHGSSSSDSARSFIASCRLSELVCRLQAEVGTLGAVSGRSAEQRKEEVEEIGKLADKLLNEWKEHLSTYRPRPTGVPSLLLHLLGLRCMLKRIHIELEYGFGGMFTPGEEMLSPFHDFVKFLISLSSEELDGYFLNYASHILSSVTSSLIRLTLASSSNPPIPAMDVLATLIRTLRVFQSEHKWDVAVPAIRRATAVATRLKGHGEHEELCEALLGGMTSTPRTATTEVNVLATTQMTEPIAEAIEPQLLWGVGGMDWGVGGMDWGLGDLNFEALLDIPITE